MTATAEIVAEIVAHLNAGRVDLDAAIDTLTLANAGKPAACARYTDLRAEMLQALGAAAAQSQFRLRYGYTGNEADRGVDEAESAEWEYNRAHGARCAAILGLDGEREYDRRADLYSRYYRRYGERD